MFISPDGFNTYQSVISHWLSNPGKIKLVSFTAVTEKQLLSDLSKRKLEFDIRSRDLKARMEDSTAKVEALLGKKH